MRSKKTSALGLAAALAYLASCSSAARPASKPAPQPNQAEETLAAVTELLKLDAPQQQKTRQLLKELADRYDAIQAEWAKGAKVDPTALKQSQERFENEFVAILTPEQQRLFRDTRIRMTLQSKYGSAGRRQPN